MSGSAEVLATGTAGAPNRIAPGSVLQLIVWSTFAALAIGAALGVNGYYVFVLANVALLAIVGVGLNVLIGLTGQVSFGHVGFFAIGAYAVGVLTTKAGWGFWPAWGVGAVLSTAMGAALALPALRVKGPYLAMVTIAFGLVIEHSAAELREITGGQNGIIGIAAPALGDYATGERAVAVIAVLTTIVATLALLRLSRGTWGAAMRAVRDSDTAAASIGLNPLAIKTVAFAASAFFAGLAGGLFAPLSGTITPGSFGFIQSILFVLVVMIGGTGSVAGPLIGAVIVGLLPEALANLEEYRLLFFGVLLLVVLWAAPRGIAGLAQMLLETLRGPTRHGIALRTSNARAALGARSRAPLSASGLTMIFGGVRAVDGLQLVAVPGAVTSLIGPNGAGKSTALNMLSGFYTPTSGEVKLGERPLHRRAAHAIARSGIARTYQTSQLFSTLTAEENVMLGATRGALGNLFGSRPVRSNDARDASRALLSFCGYRGDPATLASDLAHVDRRFVEIARALATDPDVLLLDEPAAGLSREDKARMGSLLRDIAAAGVGVLLVEHDMRLVMGISDEVVVLDAGKLLATGAPRAIQQNEAVKTAYLGEGASSHPPQSKAIAFAASIGAEALGVGKLTAGYGAEPVLHEVSFGVRDGETLAILGANGAGKSTLMRALAGLHRPIAGGIHVKGEETRTYDAEGMVALGLVLVPEGRQVFAELSVRENIMLGAFVKHGAVEDKLDAVLERFPALRARIGQRAGLLSGGEQQMLAIARGLMAEPTILLLDEPSLGLAPKIIEDLFAALTRLRNEGMTLVIVDQMAALALSVADRACVIESGRIVAQGSAREIASDKALAEAYLGAET